MIEKVPLLIWGNIGERNMDWLFSKLPHAGLAINTTVDSPEQARTIWEKYIG